MRTGCGQRGLAAVALLCHLLTTFGLPLPTAPHRAEGTPYPCQTRPCGCRTSAECWKGDCCCFTLEEKLRWADEHGVEPPAHVRPLVESRKSRPGAPPTKKKSCCSEAEPATPAAPTCCAQEPAPACCAGESPRGAATTDCHQCAAAAAPSCHEQKTPDEPTSGVRWAAGVFAQKCRGDGPVGLSLHDPGIAPDLTPVLIDPPARPRYAVPYSIRPVRVSHLPPTRPPRSN